MSNLINDSKYSQCPICFLNINPNEIQNHANSCLDNLFLQSKKHYSIVNKQSSIKNFFVNDDFKNCDVSKSKKDKLINLKQKELFESSIMVKDSSKKTENTLSDCSEKLNFSLCLEKNLDILNTENIQSEIIHKEKIVLDDDVESISSAFVKVEEKLKKSSNQSETTKSFEGLKSCTSLDGSSVITKFENELIRNNNADSLDEIVINDKVITLTPSYNASYKKTDETSAEEKIEDVQPSNKRKPIPLYKFMPDTNFTVDCFNYGKILNCSGYFLTHFHSDHYGGISSRFESGQIYCSSITANLLISSLRVKPEFITRVPMNQVTMIEDCLVTFIDANHCPGAVLILFETKNKKKYLHCGDFRVSQKQMKFLKSIHFDKIYLDTTYFNADYKFPNQPLILSLIEELIKKVENGENLKGIFSKDESNHSADVHLCQMNDLNKDFVQKYLKTFSSSEYEQILTFRPTGWTFRPKKRKNTSKDLQSKEFELNDITPKFDFISLENKIIPFINFNIP
ncbi:DNA cross-link repair 1A protein, partial [Clydaea vesicula]